MGCSTHNVPSLSKVAMRCGTGTKSGEPSRVTAATKFRIDCFAAPSVHDGSVAADAAVCARNETGSSGPDKTGSAAKVERRTRRLIPEEGRVDFMFGLPDRQMWTWMGQSFTASVSERPRGGRSLAAYFH